MNDCKLPDSGDSATTLVLDQFRDRYSDAPPELALTIVFHPDPSLIGARSQVASDAVCIGRSLSFLQGSGDSAASSIGDPFVSRRACILEVASEGWRLTREAGSSALRLDGVPVIEQVLIEAAALWSGVVINLADRVLLHARCTRAGPKEDCPVEGGSLLGVSPAMTALRRRIKRLAATDDDVLLLGPSGVGKDVAAHAIHDQSSRCSGPFVAVNMAAVPEELAAASLFGAAKGAYTGADRTRSGLFEEARGGTLFLDEIGDAPPRVQPQLLRALEQREIQVVGGATKTIDVRVIAATELDPDAEDSMLRSSLRYRLATQELCVPLLSDRKEDVGLLAKEFLQARQSACPWVEESSDPFKMAAWARYFESLTLASWPGNVRQLKNAIARLDAGASSMPVLHQVPETKTGEAAVPHQAGVEEAAPTEHSVLSSMDETAFLNAWTSAAFEVSALARALGCSRSAVYRRVHASPSCRLASEVPLGELHHALDASRGDIGDAAMLLRVSKRGLEARLRAAGATSLSAAAVSTPQLG
ncbi:MAG: sigma 54-interacting transcriptional regulator [Pseudomonadota bacterium]